MVALNRVSGSEAAPIIPVAPPAVTGTTEKIKQFFNRIEGRGTLFSLLAGVAVAAVWGVKFGLLTAGIGALLTWVFASFRSCKDETAPNSVENSLKEKTTKESAHFASFKLPFDTIDLRTYILVEYPGIDLTQIKFNSFQKATFTHDYRPMGPEGHIEFTEECNGYRINLLMPPGTEKDGNRIGLVSFLVTNGKGNIADYRNIRDLKIQR